MESLQPQEKWYSNLPAIRERFNHAAHVLTIRLPADLNRGSLLDIGCGTGNTVMAAAHSGFAKAVGIDIDLGAFYWFNPSDFTSICNELGVDPKKASLIEGDFFQVDLPLFDCVTFIDVIEHVPTPERFIARAASLLAPGGVLLIDTCPLYYCHSGHHLWGYFSSDDRPWAHLRYDFDPSELDAWSAKNFSELNKVTHDQIESAVRGTGLEIVQLHRDYPTDEDRARLEKARPDLNLAGIDERLLFEAWIMLVARKAT